MSYCVLNYDKSELSSILELGTIAPISPDITGLLLETIPVGFRIIASTSFETDIGVLACHLEKIPEVETTTETPPTIIEPICVPYVPEKIKIVEGSQIIYKNIIKLFEKKLVPLFENKELLIFNSKLGVSTPVVPSDSQILLNINCVQTGIDLRLCNLRFPEMYRTTNTGAYESSQLYPCAVLDVDNRPIIQGQKNIIYVHWNALTSVSDAKILVEYLIPEYIKQTKSFIESPDAFNIHKLCDVYKRHMSSRISEASEIVRQRKYDLDGYKKKVLEASNRLQESQFVVNGLNVFLDELEENIKLKFDAARKFKEVENINVSGELIKVLTKNLFYKRNKTETYFIGKFEITINVKTGNVLFTNLAIKVNGYNPQMNAPHVWEHGGACLGNLNSELPLSIKDGNLDMAILLCVSFLQSVNESDGAGKYYANWPLVDDGKLKYRNKLNIKTLLAEYENGKEIEIS